MLEEVDLSQTIDKRKKYEKKLEKLQLRLVLLQRRLIEQQRAVLIVYEGWDAAGKGGNIRRVTEQLDPRGFEVHPIGPPTDEEKSFNYLRRFWTRLPARGRITIFDRSHYGRVLVERIEGYATAEEWKRAYGEINEFERQLATDGMIILKFWLHISKDEQLQRFKARENNPYKRWKIGPEDWRNREKWDQYYEAVEEMLHKTSREYARWHIVPANSKLFARIFTLRKICETIEEAVGTPDLLKNVPEEDEKEEMETS